MTEQRRAERVLAVLNAEWHSQTVIYRAAKMDYYRCMEGLALLVKLGLAERSTGRWHRTGRPAYIYRKASVMDRAIQAEIAQFHGQGRHESAALLSTIAGRTQ